MAPALKPLAVGLVQHERSTSELNRSQARVAVALFAQRVGCTLLDTFEFDGNALRDGVMLEALEQLALRSGARVLLTRGKVDLGRVHNVCIRARLQIMLMPDADVLPDGLSAMDHSHHQRPLTA